LTAEQIIVAARFNGPLDSGNGGYSAGLMAALADGPATVSLRSPVPLGRPLEVARDGDGPIRALDGETLVMEARRTTELDLEPPRTVSVAEAREAAGRYLGLEEGPFSRCFVCGRVRDDSLGVFAGRINEGDGDIVASPWTPPPWAAGPDGSVAPELVAAVLDCPTYFALYDDPGTLSFLAAMQVRHDAPVEPGVEHVVLAWSIEKDGRKHHAGAAVLTADGRTAAVARVLLIAAA
jgi:hypothetical protein